MSLAYEKSVERALEQNGALRPYANLFDGLPDKVAALHSHDVVALVNAGVQPDFTNDRFVVTATTLGFDGYGPAAAQDLVTKFRREHPQFNAGMAMLCSASRLDELYGSIWGPLLAETLVRPDEQPLLYQMLFAGEPGSFSFAQRRVVECNWVATMRMTAGTFDPRIDTLTEWQRRGDRVVEQGEAQYTFKAITGEALNVIIAVDIPMEILCPAQTPSS